jgi:hypothetical protein
LGETPTTTNQWAAFFDGLVKAGIQGGEAALKAYILTTPAAWLEGPIVHFITDDVIAALGDSLYKNVGNMVTAIVIDIQTNLEKSAVVVAKSELTKAVLSGDSDAIQKAKANFAKAAVSLGHWDGSYTPQ